MENLWDCADSVYSFTQLEPFTGAASSRKTIVRTLQDDDNLYFSFICYMKGKNERTARIQRRDQLEYSDDIISVVLDTYIDKRTAILFAALFC